MSAMPPVFLRYQQELMQSASMNGVTVVEKSRRTGYSWAAAAIAVMMAAAGKAAGGMNVYYMGYNLEIAREFINYCGSWAKELQLAAGAMQETFFSDPEHPERQIKAFRAEFASGFEVVALPSVPRALRGRQGFVIIDEAAFHDDLPEVLKAAMALRMWGGRVLIISTHNGEMNAFNTLVQEVREGKKPFAILRCTLDDALEQGLYVRIAQQLGLDPSPEAALEWRTKIIAEQGDAADEEFFCIPRAGGAAAIPRALIEKRMVVEGQVLRWTCNDAFVHLAKHIREAECRDWCERELGPVLAALDPSIPCVFGQDFGRKGDLSVIVPMQLLKTLTRRVPFMVELRNVPFEQQQQILFYIADRLPRMRAGKLDATGNGGFLAEVAMQRYGAGRIEPVMMSEPWYRENMPPMKAAFEDGSIELPKDRDVLDDLAMLAWVRGVIRVPERTLGSDGKGRHGDAAIALALAYAASRADPVDYDYRGGVKGPGGIYGGQAPQQRRWSEAPNTEDEDMPRAPGRGMIPVLRPL
jgi:phage FluMu gp28-like protein